MDGDLWPLNSNVVATDLHAMSIESSEFTIRIQTIDVQGRLDALGAQALRSEIDRCLENGICRFVIDLAAAEFVDSAGLAALARGMKDARAQGGDLRVVSPRAPDAQRVFSLTRFDQVFTMADDRDALLALW